MLLIALAGANQLPLPQGCAITAAIVIASATIERVVQARMTDGLGLAGKVAIVAGASRGIGKATALVLAGEGAES